jgi:ribose 5-phosphate isomerase B
MNVLCLGSRVIGASLACTLVDAFLSATFSGDERHVKRLAKIDRIESRYSRQD